MPSLFADSFTRADSSTLGTGWFEFTSGAPSNSWEIFTNQLRSPSGSGPVNVHYACTTSTAHTATADAKATCKRISGTSWDGGPLIRRQGDAGAGANTFYYVDISSATGAQIYRRVADADTAVGAAITGTFANGDTYAIEASGTTLNFYNNGSLVASRTDSNITAAGYGGVAMWSASGIWDDFDFSSLAAAATADTPLAPAQSPNRFVGPMALRLARHSPVPFDTTVATPTDAEFGTRVQVPNNQVGPPVLRALYRPVAYPFDTTLAPVTDGFFGARVVLPNNRVGPVVLRALYRPVAYPFDSTLAPVTDTNFSTRVQIPHNRVGPMALRALGRPLAYPFDSTVVVTATGNRVRRVICSASDS